MTSDLRRREEIEDREQATERKPREGVPHEFEDENTAYRIVRVDGVLRCQKRMTTGEWGRVYYATPLMREILRLRDQVRAAMDQKKESR